MNWLYRISLIFLLCAGSVHVYAQNTSAQESRKAVLEKEIAQLQKQIKIIKEKLQCEKGTTVIPFSAETKQGRDEIWKLIDEITGYEEPVKK